MATHSDENRVWVIPADLRQRLLDALADPERLPKITYEAFLDWADEDTLAEWVNGEIEMASPASSSHQQIVLFLSRLLASFLDVKPQGSVYVAPFQMKLAHSGREPDVLFIKTEHLDRVKKTYLHGPADLVVEVVSPERMARDRGAKVCRI